MPKTEFLLRYEMEGGDTLYFWANNLADIRVFNTNITILAVSTKPIPLFLDLPSPRKHSPDAPVKWYSCGTRNPTQN